MSPKYAVSLSIWGYHQPLGGSDGPPIVYIVLGVIQTTLTNHSEEVFYSFVCLAFFYMYNVYLHICICITCVPAAQGGQRKSSDPLEPELWVVMSCHMVLGIELGCPARTSALNC